MLIYDETTGETILSKTYTLESTYQINLVDAALETTDITGYANGLWKFFL